MSVRSAVIFVAVFVAAICINFPATEGAAVGAGDNQTQLTGPQGLVAYVAKRGGKIAVYRNVSYVLPASNSSSNGSSHDDDADRHRWGPTGKVEVFIDEIQEVDANLETLKGNAKISSFSNIDFQVTMMRNVSLPFANASGVYADCLNCSGTLDTKVGGGSRVSLSVCAITSNGTLNLNGELTNVTEGQLKIAFTLANWPFQAVTNKLTVDIVIKVPAGRNVHNDTSNAHRTKPKKYSLGADSFMDFSQMVLADDAWYTMPTGYPLYTSKGANNVIRLVLDHFNDTATYDPALEVGNQVDNSAITVDPTTADPGTGGVERCGTMSLFVMLLTLLLSVV